MADFDSHRKHALRNIEFLGKINSAHQEYWDWQVTVVFYASVHFIHAHLAKTGNQHYRSHQAVFEAIDFGQPLSLTKVPEDVYIAYRKLMNLSRRSRYLINDSGVIDDSKAYATVDKHFSKAIKHLDTIIDHSKLKYGIQIPNTSINCIELKIGSLRNFTVVK